MAGRKTLGLSFYVSLPLEVSGRPERRNIVNNFDLSAGLISLVRQEGEDNVSYKDRIWDTTVHPGGPLYEGIINNLTRAFGFLRVPAIQINLKLQGEEIIAIDPRIEILANQVILYKDYQNSEIDRVVLTYNVTDQGYYLEGLKDAIDVSECFSCDLLEDIRPKTITNTLIRRNSDSSVLQENIKVSKRFFLENAFIMKGTLSFAETDIFKTEVLIAPSAPGEYLVNYRTGEINVFSLPSGYGTCSYLASEFPFVLDSSIVQLFTFQDENFKDSLFEERVLPSGQTERGLLTSEGSEIYHRLYKDCPIFWGK